MTVYGAVNGPYLKGRIALECSDRACPYRHVTSFNAHDGRTIHKVEQVFGSVVKRLPTFGPWTKLEIADKLKKRRSP